MSKSMRAGILYGVKDIRVGEILKPTIEPDEVLIKTQAAGICGTDIHIFRGEFKERVNYPAILGHEFGGVIAEAGENVRKFKVGDRVVVDPIISCNNCPACLTGHINACQTLKLFGIDLAGGYGKYVAVPERHLYHLPSSIPMIHAPMVEMYALGHHILQRGRVQPGETIAILGAGKLGLSILDVLCHSVSPGVSIVTDFQPSRLEMAKKLGADIALNIKENDPVDLVLEFTGGAGVDCVIEAVGHYHCFNEQESPLSQAVKMIRSGGRVVTAGLGEQKSAIFFKDLVLKEAQIIASRVSRGEFPRAIHMMSQGLLHPEILVTNKMALEEITEAFNLVNRERSDTIKVILEI
jgi:2-desacetyl-2-hydroxyethyl bacteriochlorophyllide A dehydrogenase